MSRNSFRELQEESERIFKNSDALQKKVKSEVWGSLGFLRFLGDIVNMYLPNVVNVFIVAAGGNKSNFKNENYSDAPSLGGLNRAEDLKPGNPEADQNTKQ